LAEKRHRFKIRSGEIEIEYEGSPNEVNERYDDALKWLDSHQPRKTKTEKIEPDKKDQKDRRGGARKAIYPPWIQKLKEEGFFQSKKTLDETIKQFESMGVPTRSKRSSIRNALINDTHKQGSKLKSTKEGNTWVFWED
jgi:hypothetical protein